jgi:hypothetical protein
MPRKKRTATKPGTARKKIRATKKNAAKKKTHAKKKRVTTPYTILAVAIGESLFTSPTLINSDPAPSGVRPYIQGLINGLSYNKYTIGTDYSIDYWECPASQLDTFFQSSPFQNLTASTSVFCMSTRVVTSALKYLNNIPIVGIVSDYGGYTAPNLCGFSAKRFQSALDCYNNFLATVSGLTTIYVLHDKDYPPSVKALATLPNIPPAQQVDVREKVNGVHNDIKKQLDNAGIPPRTGGLLVLPIDRCFGAADNIINAWACSNSVPTFWPVTDWVESTAYPSALGGYGVDQELCGYRMADKLAYIWSHGGTMPPKLFADCVPGLKANGGDFSFTASLNVAQKIGVKLGSPPGLNVI